LEILNLPGTEDVDFVKKKRGKPFEKRISRIKKLVNEMERGFCDISARIA